MAKIEMDVNKGFFFVIASSAGVVISPSFQNHKAFEEYCKGYFGDIWRSKMTNFLEYQVKLINNK